MAAQTIAAHGGSEGLPSRGTRSSYDEYQYSEEQILSVARELCRDGKQRWSENPRLYIILRDIDQSLGTSTPELIDKFIDEGINDTWLPIGLSDVILDRLLPRLVRPHFLRAQQSVCVRPSEFQLGNGGAHGHFTSGNSTPFCTRGEIGSGSFGVVDEVLSSTDGQIYARKTIRRSSDFSRATYRMKNFWRELQALSRIRHRHCVRIVGSYTEPRGLAIIMSPKADCNLGEFLQHAEMSLEPGYASHLRGWFGCLATAVEYLHANRFRHRDIKPANILVHRRQVLLADFGLVHDSKGFPGSTTSGETRGTLRYAAPEVVLQNRANSSSDIWSLGCVFLEMATVLKGRWIHQLQDHFKSQADNANFYNNEHGIAEWISILEGLSDVGNAPFPWISKMLQRDRKLRPRAAEVVELIRNSDCSPNRSSQYFCKHCQKAEQTFASEKTICSSCTAATKSARCILTPANATLADGARNSFSPRAQCACISRSHICWNLDLVRTSLPVQHVRLLFHPYFMVRHLTIDSMNEFTRWVVSEDRWDSVGVNVRLSCLPRQPLHFKVRKFVPSCHLLSHGKEPGTSTLRSRDSLSVGIYKADPELMAKTFNKYVDNIVDNNLMDHSAFLLRLCEGNHSSRVLDCLFDWYYAWKKEIPHHELTMVKSAIKFIAIYKILGQLPKLEMLPEAFQHDKLNGHNGPQPYFSDDQSSRLVTRQIKVGFFLLQTSLLDHLLNGLRCLLRQPDSWTTCLFVSMCLAFVLERLVVESRAYLEEARKLYKDDPGKFSDIQDYCLNVDSIVFQRIYRLLSVRIRNRCSNGSPMARDLSETLINLRLHFQFVECHSIERDVQTQHSSRLVSALLDLL